MYRFILAVILILGAAAPALAKDKPQVHDSAPLRYGMELAAAEQVVGDAAMWRVAYRVETESTCEFAAIWSGSVYYRVRFLDGKCCYIEKRAEVGPEEVDQLLQMYRGVYGDSPEATSSRDGRYIFSRWQAPNREVTISAVGRHGIYKLFYEEFDPVGIGDVRVAQERELGRDAETDPLTGKRRLSPLGQAAEQPGQPGEPEDPAAGESKPAAPDEAPADEAEDAAEDEAQPADEKPQEEARPKRPKEDPVTGDRV